MVLRPASLGLFRAGVVFLISEDAGVRLLDEPSPLHFDSNLLLTLFFRTAGGEKELEHFDDPGLTATSKSSTDDPPLDVDRALGIPLAARADCSLLSVVCRDLTVDAN
jgi:hypothetical protein